MYFYTVRKSTVGTAAILLYSSPAFVTLLGWTFLKEALGFTQVLTPALAYFGSFFGRERFRSVHLEVTPFVLLTRLLSGLTYELYSIFGKPLSAHLSLATILSYALGVGAALHFAAALPTLHALAGLPLDSYALLFMLAVVHTYLAYGLYTAGLKCLMLDRRR